MSSLRWTPESLRATIRDADALSAHWTRASASGHGTIRGEHAVAFLRPSGLSDGALSKIWKAATRGTGRLASAKELGECLELVAREMEAPNAAFVTPGAGGEGKSVGGGIVESPRTPASASATTVKAAPMTDAERRKYFGHFRTLDVEGKGAVSVDGAVKFLSKAALPMLSVQLCVARASRGASTVDREAFAAAMHDVYALIRAQGNTPVTPMMTPSASVAPSAPVPSVSDASVSKPEDNFFASAGAPTLGASALEATSAMSLDSLNDSGEIERLERESQARAEKAKREVQAADAKRAAAEARIARAQRAIDAADEDVNAARAAVEAAEAEAERMKRDATARLDNARQQHAELVQKESRVKADAQQLIAAKKAQYQSTLAEYERLRAQVANASAVAALPVKAMQDKLSKIEAETRSLKTQTDKAAADASQALMKRAVEVAKAERAKAAAMREMQAVDAKLEMETSRSQKQLEALQAETEALIAKREAKTASHPAVMEDLSAKIQKCREDAVKEKEKTESTIAACDKERSDLEAKVSLAKAELEAAKSVMDSDLATHKLKLEEKRTSHEEVSEAVRQALEKRRALAENQAMEMSVLDDKIIEAESALKAEEAAFDAQEQSHQKEMSTKEGVLANLNSKIDAMRAQMEDKYLMSQQALSQIEARIDAAELKFEEQQQEMELGMARLGQESDELTEKLRVAKEKDEQNAKDKVQNQVLVASKRAEVEELKQEISTESSRIEREVSEAQTEFATANAALDAERSALSNALQKLRETLPKSAAVLAQIEALRSSKETTELYRMEAEATAEKAMTSYEEVLRRLENIAMQEAENAADAGEPLFADAQAALASAGAVTFDSNSFQPTEGPGHERLPSFVDFEVSPVMETKTPTLDADFGEPFGASDAFGEPDDIFAAGGGDVFAAPPATDVFATSNATDFDDVSFTMAPTSESQFRSFSLDEPEPEVPPADDFTAAEEPIESFGAFEEFQPEATGADSPFEPSTKSAPTSESQFRSFSLDEPEPEVPPADDFTAAEEPIESFGAFEEFQPEATGADSPFEPSAKSLEFTGADTFEPMSDEARSPSEDPFAVSSPTEESAPAFTTFDNQAFTSNDDQQWQDDFASSPPREESSWNPDESTDDAFATAQKPSATFDSGFEANESVFATPSALAFQGGNEGGFSSLDESSAAPPTPAEDYTDARDEMEEEPHELYPIPPEDLSRSNAAWEKLRGDANAPGVTGEQIVSLATKTGLDNSDLAVIWNISCTPGASELSMHDFALFMHFLKHRVNGGELPYEVDAERRAYFLGAPEMIEQPPSPPTIYAETVEDSDQMPAPSTYQTSFNEASTSNAASAPQNASGDRLRIFIESVANVKEASKMSSAHFGVTLVDGEGTPIEPSQNTPIGVQVGPDDVMRVQGGVTLNSLPAEWPEGSAVVLELRHYKQKEKKMSTRCWSFMEKESIRLGLFGLPLAAKPADTKRRKVKLYNKGNPDLKIRFSFVGRDE